MRASTAIRPFHRAEMKFLSRSANTRAATPDIDIISADMTRIPIRCFPWRKSIMTAFPPGRLYCRQTDGSHQEYQTMRRAERFFRSARPFHALPSPPRKPFAPANASTLNSCRILGHEKRPCRTQSLFLEMINIKDIFRFFSKYMNLYQKYILMLPWFHSHTIT